MKNVRSGWLFYLPLFCLVLHACTKREKIYLTLTTNRSEFIVDATAGKEYIEVKSTRSWSLKGLPEWITAKPLQGDGNATVELVYTANLTKAVRIGNFEITNTEVPSTSIPVKFSQIDGGIAITSFTEHAKGGDEITINGFGFSDKKEENKVFINGKPAEVSQSSLMSLIVKVPMGADDGPIMVKVLDKTKTTTKNFVYDWTWQVTTVAGNGTSAVFQSPTGLAVTKDGKIIYVADRDNHRVRKIVLEQGSNSQITTLAGSDERVSGKADGPGSVARFTSPYDISIDESGTLYVPDGNSFIRRISSTGEVSKVLDGAGIGLNILSQGITTYGTGNLVVSDINNNSIRHISPGGVITTIAGSVNNEVPFNRPKGLVVSRDRKYIYVCDSWNNRVQQVSWDIDGSKINVIKAGSATGVQGKENGSGTSATFYTPTDIAIDGQGNMYVADQYNHLIRKLVSQADGSVEVSTISGTGNPGYQDDVATKAAFNFPTSIAVNNEGTVIYIADSGNNRIRKLAIQ